MALASGKITVSQLKTTYKVTAAEFDWPNGTSAQLTTRLGAVVSQASRRVQQLVGVDTYASTDDLTAAMIIEGELAFGGCFVMRQRLMILTSRPEEAPPTEFIDPQFIENEIERLHDDAREVLGPYIVDDLDKAGTGFSFGARGVDETRPDRGEWPYTARDFGDLPS